MPLDQARDVGDASLYVNGIDLGYSWRASCQAVFLPRGPTAQNLVLTELGPT
jgi:hypothetical protein